MANSTYKPLIMQPEIRVSNKGWKSFLDQWEREQLLIFKKRFLEFGLIYSDFNSYLTGVSDPVLKLDLSRNVIPDMLDYPGRDAHENAEGERRLQEAQKRLKYLMERLPETELSIEHQALMRDSLLYSPATEADIQAAESRLDLCFPPSYREFLGISNGWLMNEEPSVWPVEKVLPLREFSPKYLQVWAEHEFLHEAWENVLTPEPLGEGEAFVTQDLNIPTACLNQALVIGYEKTDSAFLILDPTVIDERGEWRAMTLFRYEYAIVGRDFARLMEILYRMNTRREAT